MRYWLYPAGRDSKLLTGPQLISEDVHPLRCFYLGSFAGEAAAIKSAAKVAMDLRPENVIARNIRIACDRRQTKRWRLSDQEIDLLIAGNILRIKDRLGQFAIKYSRL